VGKKGVGNISPNNAPNKILITANIKTANMEMVNADNQPVLNDAL
jgi:hypothetical protein